MLEKIYETTNFIKSKISSSPEIGIILGTGLGGLVDEIVIEQSIAYEEIPNFPISTVEGHSGRLIFGLLSGKKVVAMQGRFHYYEGYNMQEVTFPIRVMKHLGIQRLFLSNASGGMHPDFEIGDLMILTDHINMLPEHPLRGKNFKELGPRFPDMSEPYEHSIIKKALILGEKLGIKLQQGTYLATSGPTFETPAEYQMFRNTGADAVGMSTVPEVIVAKHMGIPCFAISIITDLGVPGKIVEISHEEVLKVAAIAEKKMTALIREILAII
ncbi:MAG: purine-nucleoside phosphorylase [Bacteroidota bacterium]